MFILALSAEAASSVTLVWNANSEGNASGYRIHYGTGSHSYTNQLDVGNVTTGTIRNLANGTTYFIVLTAYNAAGLESQPSNEISFTTSGPGSLPTATPRPTATPGSTPHPTPRPSATPPSGHSPTPTPPASAAARRKLLNVAARTFVQNGQDVTIGGFIVTGDRAKKVIVRGIGPSLKKAGIRGAMADPVLELHDSRGTLIDSNDNWTSDRSQIEATGMAPSDDRESAIVATLQPGNYTCILRSKTGIPGVGLFELYDLDPASSHLANISTRGRVGVGENVVIGGFIIGGDQPTRVLIRAIGPSLARTGISDALQDPKLELHGSTGALIFANDNWRTAQQQQIEATHIPPTDNREAAIFATLTPGTYTAIVRGSGNLSGIALVEVYNLDN